MKKIIVLILAICISINFTACQLAVETEEGSTDKLTGILITTEYLDLFDAESYLQDNINNLKDGNIIEDNGEYNQRIYATIKDERFVFENLDGIGFYSYDIVTKNGNICNVMEGGTQIFDANYALKSTDDGESYDISGTIKYLQTNNISTFYINPVYQTTEGKLYVTTGQGISSNGGGSFSQTLEEETTINNNDEMETYSIKLKITLEDTTKIEKYRIIQMDKNSEQIEILEYSPEEMPQDFIPNINTAYLIVEEISTEIKREIIEKDTEFFGTRNLGKNNIFENGNVNIIWNDKH